MGYLKIGTAGVIWACTGPILRKLVEAGFTSWDIVMGRCILSIVFMGVWLMFRQLRASKDKPREAIVPDRGDISTFAAMGFLAVFFSQSTYFYALSVTSVAIAVTLNYTAPFFVMILSYFVFKERITREKAAALVGAVAGVALVSGIIGDLGTASAPALGVVAGLLSGAGYGAQTVIFKKVGRRYGPLPLNFWTMVFGGIILTIGTMLIGRQAPPFFGKIFSASPDVLALFALMGLGPGTLAFVLFSDGINRVEATRGIIVAMCEPIAAGVLGYLILGESLTLLQTVGVGLVLGSIWMVSVREVPKKQSSRQMAATRD